MGWTFDPSMTRLREVLVDRTAQCTIKNMQSVAIGQTQCLKKKYVLYTPRTGTLWTVLEQSWFNGDPPKRWIGCDLIEWGGKKRGWGWKSMTEEVGPTDLTCPLVYLEMVPDPGGLATAWRSSVQAYANATKTGKRLVSCLKPGDRVYLKTPYIGDELVFVGMRGTKALAQRASTGTMYVVKPRTIDVEKTVAGLALEPGETL
jgi:hypothetical protein